MRSHWLSVAAPLTCALLAPWACWVFLFAVVPPALQEFPVDDDWAFGRGALDLAAGQGIHYYGWASMPQLGQWLWACPFVWTLGASPVVLRLSTMVLSTVGLAGFYDLLRTAHGLTRPWAAVTVTCLALNPLYFMLATTYHTDVPALAFSLCALALYIRGLKSDGGGWWLTASMVALLAISTRQNAVVVLLTTAILLWQHPVLRHSAICWLSVTAPLVVGVAIHFWFSQREDIYRKAPQFPSAFALLYAAYVALHLMGLSALPLLALPRPGTRLRFVAVLLIIVCLVALLYSKLPFQGLFPYIGSYWLVPASGDPPSACASARAADARKLPGRGRDTDLRRRAMQQGHVGPATNHL